MAKQPTSKGGSSRIRFIMLDAEIPDGDLSQVVSAIQNALKPAAVAIAQRNKSLAGAPAIPGAPAEGDFEIEGEVVEQEIDDVAETSQRIPKEPRKRRPVSMNVLELDLDSGHSFESFAKSHPAKNEAEKNLVILAWFKQHRPSEPVSAHHVYTCYKKMRWSTAMPDFSSTLRSLKHQQVIVSPSRGVFAINHLGLDRVENLKVES